MRLPNPQTHQACRSLLQKAVRRGDVLLTNKLVHHLVQVGDADWLKMRVAVITFEECWPLGITLPISNDIDAILECLIRVGQAVKVKDAAGLGVLAYELSRGNSSVLRGTHQDQHINNVWKAIEKPQDFWVWATQKCTREDQLALLALAQKAYRRGGWPWDRALIQASVYLAAIEGVPVVELAKETVEETPLWVGLDKHTPQGKRAFQEVAEQIGISARQLSWISFYLESARVNDGSDSYWWTREYDWRLGQLRLTHDAALSIWDKARTILIETLKDDAEILMTHLEDSSGSKVSKEISKQLDLWN